MPSMQDYGVVICGGGPAGIGPIMAAVQAGTLSELLDRGVLLIEQSRVGPGSLANYRIRANSLGGVFLECLDRLAGTPFDRLRELPETRELRRHADEYPPLRLVAGFLARLGEVVVELLRAHPACDVWTGARVDEVRIRPAGVEVTAGHSVALGSRVVLAVGGRPMSGFESTPLPGGLTLASYRDRLCHSEAFIDTRRTVPSAILESIRDTGRIAIVGGAHSAWSTAVLLREDPELADPELTIVHRGPIRLFYRSAAEATADGYRFDPVADVCPASGRVNRFGGLRGPAFALARRALGLAAEPAPVRLLAADGRPGSADEITATLDAAGAVVVATGYAASLPRVVGRGGAELTAALSPTGTVVSPTTEFVDQDGVVHPEILAYGLGAGLPASIAVGGEPSYTRRADGVWLYQNDIGRVVLDRLLAPAAPLLAGSGPVRG